MASDDAIFTAASGQKCGTAATVARQDVAPPVPGYGLALVLVTAGAVAFAFWRAWIADDAFITFRHVANCLAGYGPVFNVGERVQGFTHPLWFLLLLTGSCLVDVYAVAVVAGLVCTAVVFLAIGLSIRHERHALVRLYAAAAVLLSSHAFVEYQTSGLETSLTHALVATLFGWLLVRQRAARPVPVRGAAVLCALLLLNRPDHVFLCLPIVVWLVMRAKQDSVFHAVWRFLPAVVLLVAWYGFAALYYGTPAPNTAYAKVATSLAVSAPKGLAYLWDYAVHEPVHSITMLGVLVTGLIVGVRGLRIGQPGAGLTLCLALSLCLHAAYIVVIGGDFMRGRFCVVVLTGAVVLGAHLAGAMLPVRGLGRPMMLGVGSAAALVGWAKIGSAGWPESFSLHAVTITSDIGLVAFGVAGVLLVAGLASIRHRPHRWRAAAVMLLVGMVECVLLTAVAASYPLPWPMVALFVATAVAGAVILGRLVAGASVSVAWMGSVVFLAAGVVSLCDVWPRDPTIDFVTGICDEYAWYAAPRTHSRFHEMKEPRYEIVRDWVRVGDLARRYADAHGPITLACGAIGLVSYHAGPAVHIVDKHGLTDPFVARCPSRPESRPGHVEYIIPADYFRSRGVINALPDWPNRLVVLDPTLAAEAKAMMQSVRWLEPAMWQRWLAVQCVIAGPVWSRERLSLLPWYALPAR
ncbi:MAG: hypothetical protein JXA69_03410 [Phycisphaerae bacterium]|nr:hypothetical protein [Phycisphaerae bacterium]